MATYVNDLRLTELATGEGSGTWGTTTNQSLELIGEALGYATQQAFGSDADATTTVADGASDPARAMYYKITSAASLTATRTLTIAPNTISRVMFIENATSGSQSIAISQGSGANVTIATGKTAVVYLDGAGATAAVVDAMSGVDPGVTDTLTEVLVAGNTSGGTNIELSTTDKVQFRDADIYLNSSVDGQLDIVADTEIQIAATTVDLNGDLDVSGTTVSAGKITADAGIDIDNINIDGTTIALSSGDLTLDVAGDIVLDAGGSEIRLSKAGTEFGKFATDIGTPSQFAISSSVLDGDIKLQGNDGGITITALTLDMSEAGAATFNAGATFGSGIDVTGSVTADGGLIEGSTGLTIRNDAVGANEPKLVFDNDTFAGATYGQIQTGNGGLQLLIESPSTSTFQNRHQLLLNGGGSTDVTFKLSTDNGTSYKNQLQINNNDISFYEDTGTTPKLTWSATNERLTLTGSDYQFNIQQGANQPWYMRAVSDGTFRLHLNGTGDVLTADTSGNVGIGVSAPTYKIDATTTSGGNGIKMARGADSFFEQFQSATGGIQLAASGSGAFMAFRTGTTAGTTTERMRIDSVGTTTIKTDGTTQLVLNRADASIQATNQVAQILVTGDDPSASQSGAAISFTAADAWATNSYQTNIIFSNDQSGTLTPRMTLDATGNLLVGRTNPSFGNTGHVLAPSGFVYHERDGGDSVMYLNRLTSDGDIVRFYKDSITQVGSIGSNAAGGTPVLDISANSSSGIMRMLTSGTERMRIDASGNLAVGTTVAGARLIVKSNATAILGFGVYGDTTGDTAYNVAQFGKFDNDTTTSQVFVNFVVNNGGAANGQINANGSGAVAFGSWSDRRLKENITDLPNQLANITALRPVEFDYIESEGGGHQLGFIAQEVEEIYPDLVGERQDGMKTLSGMGKMEARLIKAIQEQQATIEALTARIAALES
jgi:hypothetical protein